MKLILTKHHICNMVLRFLILLSFFFGASVYAQKYIHGEIIDSKTGNFIYDVTVSSVEKNKIVRTSSEGKFTMMFESIDEDFSLKLEHIGYKTKIIIIDKYYRKRIYQDTIFLKINLKEKDNDLPEMVVKSDRKPDTVYSSIIESVEDYIVEDNKLILLTYDKTLRKGSQIVIQEEEKRLEFPVPDLAKTLFTNYKNQQYVICEKSVYQLNIKNDSLELNLVDETYFYDIVMRINDSINHKYYYSNFQEIYPAFTYYSVNTKDSVYHEIHNVEDKFMMELYRSEYKYVSGREKLWAYRQELKTGIDKEVWIGAKYFTSSLYYKSLYAPVVTFGNELLIFDHYTDYLYKVDVSTDKKTDSLAINYHLINGKEKWKQPMIFDIVEQKAYALFQKGGQLYLRNIDLTTGKITESFKIHYRFAERISVVGGKVYYVYRPYESAQKKFIYSERI